MATNVKPEIREHKDRYEHTYSVYIGGEFSRRYDLTIKRTYPLAVADPTDWEVWFNWSCGDDVGAWTVADFDQIVKTLVKTGNDDDLFMRVEAPSHGTYAVRIQMGDVHVGEGFGWMETAMNYDELKIAWYTLKRKAK